MIPPVIPDVISILIRLFLGHWPANDEKPVVMPRVGW